MVFALPLEISQIVIRFCATADAVRLKLLQRLPDQVHFEIVQHCSAYEAFSEYQSHLAEMEQWEEMWGVIHEAVEAHFTGQLLE